MNVSEVFRIAHATRADDLAATITLFRAYARSLDVDLSYQNFEAELADLPGKYGPPTGALLLARSRVGAPVGCVGLRAMDGIGCCELKRLYVSRDGRGAGLGGRLIQAVICEARWLGYREIRLDTLPSMTQAIALYRRFGFELTQAYYDTPVSGTLFMRLDLELT